MGHFMSNVDLFNVERFRKLDKINIEVNVVSNEILKFLESKIMIIVLILEKEYTIFLKKNLRIFAKP